MYHQVYVYVYLSLHSCLLMCLPRPDVSLVTLSVPLDSLEIQSIYYLYHRSFSFIDIGWLFRLCMSYSFAGLVTGPALKGGPYESLGLQVSSVECSSTSCCGIMFSMSVIRQKHRKGVNLVFTGQAPGWSFLSLRDPCFHGE